MDIHVPGSTLYERAFRNFSCTRKELITLYPRIYTEGNDRPLLEQKRPKIFITGLQLITVEDESNMEKLIGGLADVNKDIVIVSGLAHGVQRMAHTKALENKLSTVAVIPSGLKRIYPARNINLAREIVDSGEGCLLSPVESMIDVTIPQITLKNNICASLSDAVICISCNKNGSVMTSALFAETIGITVYAFTGDDRHIRFEDCNRLVREGKAQAITDIQAFCREFGKRFG